MLCSLFLLSFSISTVLANLCRPYSLVAERCTTNKDCLGNENAIENSFCVGRANDTLIVCPNKNVKICRCYPSFDVRYCINDAHCPDQMYCGISPRTGNKFCAGCLALHDTNLNLQPANKKTAALKCGTRKRHYPCGRALDFCSPTMPCATPYECVHRVGRKVFRCGNDNSPCQCQLIGSGTSIHLRGCANNSDCKDPRESCTNNVQRNIRFCASCDAVRQSPELRLRNGSKCTKLFKKAQWRPPPKAYVDGSNGRTFDICVKDVHCTGNRKCMQFKNGVANPLLLRPCSSSENLCFCRPPKLSWCSSASNCQRGESCATLKLLRVYRKCVSNSLLDSLSRTNYQIIGKNRPIGSGSGLTRDVCKFDWDCKFPRRCTAIGDKFGGCAGREACTCEPLIYPQCKSNNSCSNGEVCVSYIGGKLKPFCVSLRALKLFPDLQIFPKKSGTVKRLKVGKNGLTGDPCRWNNDCASPRVCRHFTEYDGTCNGRRSCYCAKNGKNSCWNTRRDCAIGEICVAYKGAFPINAECFSEKAFRNDTLSFRRQLGKRHPRTPNQK